MRYRCNCFQPVPVILQITSNNTLRYSTLYNVLYQIYYAASGAVLHMLYMYSIERSQITIFLAI